MIKVQYVADRHIQAGWIYYPSKCDACGKSIEEDKASVIVSFEHDSVWNDIVLCGECIQELYEKIRGDVTYERIMQNLQKSP